MHTCNIRLPALTRSCAWIGLSSTSCYITASSLSPCGQLQTSVWKRRLESGCESAPCENRESLVAANFSIDIPFTNMVDWISSMLQEGVEPYILPKKIFCFLNGRVTKNRTLALPSCQVRRLSELKSACLINLYSFVCSVARRVLSFVEASLCYAHGFTFLALFLLPSPKSSVTCRDNDLWCPDGFRQWIINFVPAWRPDCPCQGWK